MNCPWRQKQLQHLRPGPCECEHDRSSHVNGTGRCKGMWAPDEETPEWNECSCQIYIRDDDGGGDASPETPSPSELEELFNK